MSKRALPPFLSSLRTWEPPHPQAGRSPYCGLSYGSQGKLRRHLTSVPVPACVHRAGDLLSRPQVMPTAAHIPRLHPTAYSWHLDQPPVHVEHLAVLRETVTQWSHRHSDSVWHQRNHRNMLLLLDLCLIQRSAQMFSLPLYAPSLLLMECLRGSRLMACASPLTALRPWLRRLCHYVPAWAHQHFPQVGCWFGHMDGGHLPGPH